MEITLLGIKLEDYPETKEVEDYILDTEYNRDIADHNIRAFRRRLDDSKYDSIKELKWYFVKESNAFNTTKEIIARVRIALGYNILKEQEWKIAIPLIERGLKANKDYVDMLDEMSLILEKYCSEYKDLDMRSTFCERVRLECWQGRFSNIWSNPKQKPSYS